MESNRVDVFDTLHDTSLQDMMSPIDKLLMMGNYGGIAWEVQVNK